MSRKRIGPVEAATPVKGDLADKLIAELKANKEYGQPFIVEQEYPTKKVRVTVIWDEWVKNTLEERTAIILRAYEAAEGPDFRGRIALASGLTVPEAHAAGILPYQIITMLRKSDPFKPEDVFKAMVNEGGSTLLNPETVQLRFATQEEAEASVKRLAKKLPGSEDIWTISHEIVASDYINFRDTAEAWKE
jgi:hypothetical protein